MSTVINKNYFDNILVKYDVIPIEKIFESIGGLYINNKFDCSKIPDKINIEMFYNLPSELRYKILKHILGSDENCCAWSIHMKDEERNTPQHLRSNHKFPKIYELECTMGDKSNDVFIKEILLKLEENKVSNDKEIVDLKIPKTKAKKPIKKETDINTETKTVKKKKPNTTFVKN